MASHPLQANVTATATVDLWLFWTTATALITFTHPMATVYEPIPKSMHKYFHLVNLIAGAFVIYKALSSHPRTPRNSYRWPHVRSLRSGRSGRSD